MEQQIGILFLLTLAAASVWSDEPPDELNAWLLPQSWERDTDGPALSLGESGRFDNTHIFAPAVIRENDRYLMLYCGSRGAVKERVFRVGLATSQDGRDFTRYEDNPVLGFADCRRSVLTPTLLRSSDGRVLRENGRLRMWASSTDFRDESNLHTLHEVTSEDAINWSTPSGPLMQHLYAPTIIRDGNRYQMW